MPEEFDRAAWDRAKSEADARSPLPEKLPGEAAFLAGFAAALGVGVFALLQPYVGDYAAASLSIALVALIGWADTRMKWKNHARVQSEAYHWHRGRQDR